MGGKGDPLGSVQETEIWPYYKMVYIPPRIFPGECDAQNSLGFGDINRSPNPSQKTRSSDDSTKKENLPS